ncbi:MAG: pitrilysin family protein [Gemmatimonadota bacterium]
MSKRRLTLHLTGAALTLFAGACAGGAGPRPSPPELPTDMPEHPPSPIALDRTMAPDPGPAPTFTAPAVRRFTLANELQVMVVEQHELPVVDVQLVVRAGAAADLPPAAGRAALMADLLDEGTRTMSALELADAVDFLGASLQVYPGWDATTVALHVLKPHLEAALLLLGQVATEPAFPAEEFQRKREQRLNAIRQELDDPRALANTAFAAVVYGDAHPYGAPLGGTASSVAALTLDGVRAFYRERFHPENATLVVAGDVMAAEITPLLERALGGWERAAAPATELPAAPRPAPTAIHIVDRPGAPQSELRVGLVGVPRTTEDYYALEVMNTVLGGAFTSRLNMRLREEKGWTYGAGSGFGYRLGPGPFQVATAVFTEVTDSTLTEIVRELRRIRDELVPEEELARARNYLALGYPRSFETTGGLAGNMAQLALYGLPADYHDRYVERILAVSAEDVWRVANAYLDPGRSAIVVAGDRARIEAGLRALRLGPVYVREPAAP